MTANTSASSTMNEEVSREAEGQAEAANRIDKGALGDEQAERRRQNTTTSHESNSTNKTLNKEDDVTSNNTDNGEPRNGSTNLEKPSVNGAPFGPPGPNPADPEASRTRLQTVVILLSLCSSVFLAALDTTIITTALPTISEHFNSNAGYTWIGSAYLLANAASTPSWGKISDIWGRKPVLIIAALIFFVGSLLAGVSVSIGMLIVARAVQGIGGGGLIILSNICVSDLFSMRNRGKYFGMIGMVWAFASAIGPILGGVFSEKVSWRWCFYINLPIIGVVITCLFFFLHLDNPRTPVWDGLKALDWFGSLFIVGGTLMLLLGLEFGGITFPWNSATVICLIVSGFLVASLFIINEWKFAKYPVMPLRLFKYRSNIASLGVCFFHGYVFIGGTYYLPLYFQAVLGATPLFSGVYTLALALSLSFMSAATGAFIKKTGKYLPAIWFGMTFMLIGFGLFIDLEARPNWAKIIIFQIIAGIGIGPNFQSPLIALQSLVPRRDIATATATFGFMRNLSTSISVVIGGVVFQNEMQKKSAYLIANLGEELAHQLSGSSAGASVSIVQALPAAEREIARTAFYQSLKTMWIMYTCFAAAGLVTSLFVGNQKLSTEHEVVKTGLAEQEANRQEAKERDKQKREMKRKSALASNENLPKEEV